MSVTRSGKEHASPFLVGFRVGADSKRPCREIEREGGTVTQPLICLVKVDWEDQDLSERLDTCFFVLAVKTN